MDESLKRKKTYLEQILELTKKQSDVAYAEAFDENLFGVIVDEKEILINNINEIDKGFTSVYDRVRSEVLEEKDRYKEELKSIQNSIKACIDIGMEIEALEERNKTRLELVFSNEKKNIRQVKKTKSVANRYYKSMSNGMVNDSLLYDRKK